MRLIQRHQAFLHPRRTALQGRAYGGDALKDLFANGRAQRRSVSGPDRETSWSGGGRELGGFYRAGGRRFLGKPPRNDARPTTHTHTRPTSWPSQAGQRPAGKKNFGLWQFSARTRPVGHLLTAGRTVGPGEIGPVGRDLGRETARDRAGDRARRPVGHEDEGFWDGGDGRPPSVRPVGGTVGTRER